jgi:hypothetical protein
MERIVLDKRRGVPRIEISREQAEEWSGAGGGPTVVEIDVVDGDKYSRFFISVGINKRGQAVCEAATNVKERTVFKRVTATRKQPLSMHDVHGKY